MQHKNISLQWQSDSPANIRWFCQSENSWIVEVIYGNDMIKRIECMSESDSFYEWIQTIIQSQSKMFTVDEMINLLKLSTYVDVDLRIDAYLSKSMSDGGAGLKFGHILSSDGSDVIFDTGIDDEEIERSLQEFTELYAGVIWHVRDFDLI